MAISDQVGRSGWVLSKLSKIAPVSLTGALFLVVTLPFPATVQAASDFEIVPFNFSPPQQSFHLRDGLDLQDGRIKELPHVFSERGFVYCRDAVAVRAEPNVNARKTAAINAGTYRSF